MILIPRFYIPAPIYPQILDVPHEIEACEALEKYACKEGTDITFCRKDFLAQNIALRASEGQCTPPLPQRGMHHTCDTCQRRIGPAASLVVEDRSPPSP